MNYLKFAAAASLLVLAMATAVSAQDVQIYPGAKQFTPPASEKAMQAMPPGATETRLSSWLTRPHMISFWARSLPKYLAYEKQVGEQRAEMD